MEKELSVISKTNVHNVMKMDANQLKIQSDTMSLNMDMLKQYET